MGDRILNEQEQADFGWLTTTAKVYKDLADLSDSRAASLEARAQQLLSRATEHRAHQRADRAKQGVCLQAALRLQFGDCDETRDYPTVEEARAFLTKPAQTNT